MFRTFTYDEIDAALRAHDSPVSDDDGVSVSRTCFADIATRVAFVKALAKIEFFMGPDAILCTRKAADKAATFFNFLGEHAEFDGTLPSNVRAYLGNEPSDDDFDELGNIPAEICDVISKMMKD